MKPAEKIEDKLKIFENLICCLLKNQVKFKEWNAIYNIFLELLENENIDIVKIKTYSLILIHASVICYYIDDEYELKNKKNQLKEFISRIGKKDKTSNKYNNIEEIYKDIFVLEQDIKIKKRNN